jgi:hypothetical protein
LNGTYFNLFTLRVLTAQQTLAVCSLKDVPADASLTGNSVSLNCNVMNLIQFTAENARLLCIDKNGLAPEVSITYVPSIKYNMNVNMKENEEEEDKLSMTCVESYLHFIVMEVLKNSMQALLELHKENADQSPPINIT